MLVTQYSTTAKPPQVVRLLSTTARVWGLTTPMNSHRFQVPRKHSFEAAQQPHLVSERAGSLATLWNPA